MRGQTVWVSKVCLFCLVAISAIDVPLRLKHQFLVSANQAVERPQLPRSWVVTLFFNDLHRCPEGMNICSNKVCEKRTIQRRTPHAVKKRQKPNRT